MTNILQNIYNIQTKLDNLDKIVKPVNKPIKVGPSKAIKVGSPNKVKIPKLLTQLTNVCYYAAGIYLLSMIPELKNISEHYKTSKDVFISSVFKLLDKIWTEQDNIEIINNQYESNENTTFNGILNESYDYCMIKLEITNYGFGDSGDVFSNLFNTIEPEVLKTIETIKNYKLINKKNYDLKSINPDDLEKCKDKIINEISANINNYLTNETLQPQTVNDVLPMYLLPISKNIYKDMQTALGEHFDGKIFEINGIYSDDQKKCSILYQKKQYKFNKYIITNIVGSNGKPNIVSNMDIQNQIILGNTKYNLICFLQNTGAHWRAFMKIENYWFMYDTAPACRTIIPESKLDAFKRESTVFLYKQTS